MSFHRRNQWQKNLSLPRLNEHLSFLFEHIIDARFVADLGPIIENSDSAGCAFANWPPKAKLLALLSPVGNS